MNTQTIARFADRAKSLADDVRDGTAAACLDSDDNAHRLNLAYEHLLTAEALLQAARAADLLAR